MISITVTPRSARRARCPIAASNVPSDGQRADVKFVEDRVGEVDASPAVVVPVEARLVDHCRWPVDTVGLPPRHRIGQPLATVEPEPVAITVPDAVDDDRPRVEFSHRVDRTSERPDLHVVRHTGALDADVDPTRVGRPHLEAGPTIDDGRAESVRNGRRRHGVGSGARNSAPSGGSVSTTDWWKPCESTGTVSTPPKLPTPLPP